MSHAQVLTVEVLKVILIEFENSVDPDEVDHYEPPHLGLHCLLVIVFEWERLFEIMQK